MQRMEERTDESTLLIEPLSDTPPGDIHLQEFTTPDSSARPSLVISHRPSLRSIVTHPFNSSDEALVTSRSETSLAGNRRRKNRLQRFSASSRTDDDIRITGSDDIEELRDLRLPYDDYSTIDWMRDWMRHYRRQHRLVSTIRTGWKRVYSMVSNTMEPWILILLIGVSLGFLTAGIDIAAAWLTDIKQGICKADWYLTRDICCRLETIRTHGTCEDFNPWSVYLFGTQASLVDYLIYVAVSVSFAVTCAYLVSSFAGYSAGSGTAEVKTILGGFIIKGFLGAKTLLIKAIGLPLVVASGLAVGKEGPMIHVACCVGNIFPRFFPSFKANEAKKREIMSAASAAGVAVAFGAPIGGVLFSLEELSTFFPTSTMLRAFFCALVSIMTLQVVDPYRGKRVLFQVSYSRNWYFFETVFFVLLGLFGGVMGSLLIRCSMWVRKYRRKHHEWFSSHPVKEVLIISSLTAFIGYFNTFTRIDSSELLEYLFKECNLQAGDNYGLCDPDTKWSSAAQLILALILKFGFTSIALSCAVPAGAFIPPMVFGALFGRTLGIMVESIASDHRGRGFFAECHPETPCVTPGMYALLGAIACLGGVTKLTVSLTVIMFELTGTLNYIIPSMITVMVAKLVGDNIVAGGITEVLIRFNRYPFLDPREDEILGVSVSEVMTPIEDLTCFRAQGMSIAEIIGIMEANDYQGFPIITSYQNANLIGYITRPDLAYAIKKSGRHADFHDGIPVSFEEPLIHSESPSALETLAAPSMPFGQLSSPEIISHTESPQVHSSTSVTGSPSKQRMSRQLIQFAHYVDMTPLSVDPRVPMEFVLDLFKKMGPRVVLVKQKGKLVGLVTKKDLLIDLLSSNEDE